MARPACTFQLELVESIMARARRRTRRNPHSDDEVVRMQAFSDLQAVFGRPVDLLLPEEQLALVDDLLDLWSSDEMNRDGGDDLYDAAKELRRRIGGARLDSYTASLVAGRTRRNGVPEKHQLAIARKSLKMNRVGRSMTGLPLAEAYSIVYGRALVPRIKELIREYPDVRAPNFLSWELEAAQGADTTAKLKALLAEIEDE